eukprot:403332891
MDGPGESFLRSDVLYKTLARDLRKYLSKDLNQHTKFIAFKRYKEKDFFISCIQNYLRDKVPVLHDFVMEEDYSNPTLNFEPESNDIIFFIGCLLYPKELWVSFQNINNQDSHILSENMKVEDIEDERFKIFHSYLYSFSLEKLYILVNLELFAFFYCYYYQHVVLEQKRIEKKKSMKKHSQAYTDAANLVLRLSQKTLKESLVRYQNVPKKQKYVEQLQEFINLPEKSLSLNLISGSQNSGGRDGSKQQRLKPSSYSTTSLLLGKNHKRLETVDTEVLERNVRKQSTSATLADFQIYKRN